MALSDYYLCDVCGGKAIYDADWCERVDPDDEIHAWRGDMRIICGKCANTWRVAVVDKNTGQEHGKETSPGPWAREATP